MGCTGRKQLDAPRTERLLEQRDHFTFAHIFLRFELGRRNERLKGGR
jgi:hypothetical protein